MASIKVSSDEVCAKMLGLIYLTREKVGLTFPHAIIIERTRNIISAPALEVRQIIAIDIRRNDCVLQVEL